MTEANFEFETAEGLKVYREQQVGILQRIGVSGEALPDLPVKRIKVIFTVDIPDEHPR